MSKNSSKGSSGLVWVPWIKWENDEIQCAPVGFETMEAVKKYADEKAAENGMKYTIF